jgi:hypothetical protein
MPWKIQYSSYEEPQGKSLNNKKKKTNIFFNFPSIQEMNPPGLLSRGAFQGKGKIFREGDSSNSL